MLHYVLNFKLWRVKTSAKLFIFTKTSSYSLSNYLTFFTIDGVANDVMQYKIKENKWERRKIISCWEMIIWLRKLEKEIPRRNTTQKTLPDKFWWWGIQNNSKYIGILFLKIFSNFRTDLQLYFFYYIFFDLIPFFLVKKSRSL